MKTISRVRLLGTVLTLAVMSGLVTTACASEEEFAVWRAMKIECDPCGKAGKVVVEAIVDSEDEPTLKIAAFGREHLLPAPQARQLADFPLSSIRVTHEAGYAAVGGYSVHVRFKRIFYDEQKKLVEETALLTICAGKPGEVTLSKSRREVQ